MTTRILVSIRGDDEHAEFGVDVDDAELQGLELAPDAEQRVLADLRRRLSARGIYLPARCRLALLQRRAERIVDADGEPVSIVDAKVTADYR